MYFCIATIRLDLEEGLTFAGATTGLWHKPFGIKWASIGNIQFKIGINPSLPPPFISILGK